MIISQKNKFKRMKSNIFLLFFSIITMVSCTSKIDFTPVVVAPISKASDLLISEVSTGINTDPLASGLRSHYVEIYNGTNASVDLSNYAIGYNAVTDTFTLANWSFSTAGSYIQLRKMLDTGKCYVITSPISDLVKIKSDTTWGTTSNLSAAASSPLQLSGNSAIALLKKDAAGAFSLGGTNYKIIDVFGSPIVVRVNTKGTTSARNNIMWTIAGETSDTRNRTFWRKSTVLDPTTDWATAKGTAADNSQWMISGDRLWDYTNIGFATK